MLELEGVLGISYSNFSILLMEEKGLAKRKKRFIGGKVRTLYFQPRAHSPLLHYQQESEIEVSTEDSGGKPIPSTSGSAARWTDSEVEQETEF